ncbi:hypothetical protein [uncultured Parvimonas sp.]|uniref:hypothetical protein n=1 Tax=uncultured Parvimonas sp. TaxID=747372 RepID=UPI00325FDCD5
MKKVRKLMLISVLALPFIIPTVVKANEQCNPESVVNDELEGLPIEPARKIINPITGN